jgi:SAM-dependent methyltransferase
MSAASEFINIVQGLANVEVWGFPAILARFKQTIRPAFHRALTGEAWLRDRLGAHQGEKRITRDANRFWNGTGPNMHQYSHWRGSGIFADEERWRTIGAFHLKLYRDFLGLVGGSHSPDRILEWGCGGGANAVHFAPLTKEYVGVEVSQANLDECRRQLTLQGYGGFVPILIDAAAPEQILSRVPDRCDLFLCTYVFEVLPTPEYGAKLLRIAHDLLNENGLALIHIRYRTESWTTKPKRFGYRWNFTVMTTYWIHEFWMAAEQAGFEPLAVKLVPVQPVNGSGDYAYFFLRKPQKPAG